MFKHHSKEFSNLNTLFNTLHHSDVCEISVFFVKCLSLEVKQEINTVCLPQEMITITPQMQK